MEVHPNEEDELHTYRYGKRVKRACTLSDNGIYEYERCISKRPWGTHEGRVNQETKQLILETTVKGLPKESDTAHCGT
jgi:hypothetical protein